MIKPSSLRALRTAAARKGLCIKKTDNPDPFLVQTKRGNFTINAAAVAFEELATLIAFGGRDRYRWTYGCVRLLTGEP